MNDVSGWIVLVFVAVALALYVGYLLLQGDRGE